ncbi:MAG: IclR family transcriptional regulator [Actinomycetaceae bacterium]|nr:IclR family transcriptional regulator [Actinomycetaceae bacterium]
MPTDIRTSRSTVQSVSRALGILEIVAAAGRPISISEIAEETKLPMPTIHRLLRTLMSNGYVYQTPRRRYALGTRLISLSRYAGGALGVALRPIIGKAVVSLDESISVAMLDQDFARYISHVPSERALRMFTEVGNQVSLHATGVGKAILANMPHAQAVATIERTQLRAFTPATITSADKLLEEIARVRERGYAVDNAEHESGLKCVAVSVPSDLYLAVSVSAPVERITEERTEKVVVPALHELAKEIAAALEADATMLGYDED